MDLHRVADLRHTVPAGISFGGVRRGALIIPELPQIVFHYTVNGVILVFGSPPCFKSISSFLRLIVDPVEDNSSKIPAILRWDTTFSQTLFRIKVFPDKISPFSWFLRNGIHKTNPGCSCCWDCWDCWFCLVCRSCGFVAGQFPPDTDIQIPLSG